MKRAGILFLVFLLLYNLLFSVCIYSFIDHSPERISPFSRDSVNKELHFEIAQESVVQPFLLDSEFSNLTAQFNFFENYLGQFPGFVAHNLFNNFLLSTPIAMVVQESILESCSYFIPNYTMVTLLDNLFSFRS